MSTLTQLGAEQARRACLSSLERTIDCRQRMINLLYERGETLPVGLEDQFQKAFTEARTCLEWLEALKG